MYQVYSHHSKIIQERLQEFTQKMAKISHLEMELKQVCQTVETVYKDLCVQSEVPTSEEQNYKDGEYWLLLRGFYLNAFLPREDTGCLSHADTIFYSSVTQHKATNGLCANYQSVTRLDPAIGLALANSPNSHL